RAKLDSHLLDLAVQAGCELWRPAKVTNCELNNGNGQRVSAVVDSSECTATARWIVDATGRAAMFARKLGHFRPNREHPINAVWARFSGVKEWDSYRSEEHTSELQSRGHLVCRLLLEKKKESYQESIAIVRSAAQRLC